MSDEISLVDVTIAPLLWRLPRYQIELPKDAVALQKYANRLFSRPAFRLSLSEQEREMRIA
jgi:stringent starvation protein A